MGVIDIRLRSAQLGNLPGVRMVDTSALDEAARQQGANARAIQRGADNIIGSALRAGEAIVAMKEQDNRNEANKLYTRYVAYMDDLTTRAKSPDDPNAPEGLFLTAARDDNAARSLADALRKGQGDMRTALGLDKQSARIRELFEEQARAYDRANALKADAIMAERFHASRVGNAQAAAETARRTATNTPTAESLDAYARALEDAYDAQGIPEAQRPLLRQQAQENLLAAYLDAQADASNAYMVDALIDGLRKGEVRTHSPTDPAAHALMNRVWGGLDAKARAATLSALEAKRDAKIKAHLDALDTAQYEGRVTYADLTAQRDDARAHKVPEATISQYNALIETQRKRDVNAAILGVPDTVANATDAESARTALAAYANTLGKHVTDSPEWVAFAKTATRGTAKAAVAIKQEDTKESINQIVYGYNNNRAFVPIGTTEKRALLQNLFRTGQIDIETLNNAVAAVDATEDARTAALAQGALKSWALFRNAGVRGAEPRFGIGTVFAEAINDKGAVNPRTLASNIADFFPDTDDKRLFFDAAQRFQEAYEGWARACAENPTWSQEQCADLFHQAMRYPLEALTESNLELDEEQAREFRRQLAILSNLAKPIEGNLDWDFTSAKDLMGKAGAAPDIGLVPAQPALSQAQPGQRAQAQAAAAQNPQSQPQQPATQPNRQER